MVLISVLTVSEVMYSSINSKKIIWTGSTVACWEYKCMLGQVVGR